MAWELKKVTWMLRRRPYKVFTPKQADKVNDWMLRASRDDGGGWVILKGVHEPAAGYRIQPGIRLTGSAHPTMYTKVSSRIRPRFSGSVFTFTDGIDYGPRKAWGGATLTDLQVEPITEGLTLIDLDGGNGSDIRNISSAMGSQPLEYGIRAQGGRVNDGQYSTFDRVRLTRVIHGVEWVKNCPDCVITNSMFYMGNIRGSTGLKARGKNLTVKESHFQFVDRGLDVDTKEFELHGGSWENNSGGNPYADYAFRVGPNVTDMTVRSLSLANFSSLEGPVFDLDPAAKGYTFEYLSGHVGPAHVPAGYENHFVWHKD